MEPEEEEFVTILGALELDVPEDYSAPVGLDDFDAEMLAVNE